MLNVQLYLCTYIQIVKERNMNDLFSPTKNKMSSDTLYCIGGGERDRTDDLLRARQALSQLSYTPNFLIANSGWLAGEYGGPR